MKDATRIINEANVPKVNVAKYLGVSRQMLYNYLALDSIDELPKDKQMKLLSLFGVEEESELKNIVVNDAFIVSMEGRLSEGIVAVFNKESISDLKGLNKKEQSIITDIFSLLKDMLINDETGTGYDTLKYLYMYLQNMSQLSELKYILAYMAKSNLQVPVTEYAFNEERQYILEGILYSAMTLYNNGGASKAGVSKSHQNFEKEIESKKEEKLSRTQELNHLRDQALSELGYQTVTEANSKEVFEKIAEIAARRF